MTASRTGSGPRRSASSLRVAISRAAGDRRGRDVGQRLPDRRRPARAGRAQAMRSSSCRRRLRTATAVGSGSSRRRATATKAGSSASRLRGHEVLVVGQQPDRVGGADEQVGDVARRREQPGEPLGRLALVAQQAQVPGRRAERVRDLAEGQQTASGSAASANQPSIAGSSVCWIAARRDTPSVRASRCRSAVAGIVEAQRHQALARPERVSRASRGGQPGDGGEQRPVEELLVQPAHLPEVAVPLAPEQRQHVAAVADATAPAGAGPPRRRPAGSRWVRRSRCSCSRCSTVRSQR